MKLTLRNLFLLFGLMAIISSCKDDELEKEVSQNPKTDTYVNNWIYDVMDEVYLWTDNIPSDVDKALDPSDYFYELLYSGDRFSVIVPDYDKLISTLDGVTKDPGYEFQLLQVQGSEDVIAVVTYVKHNSPAVDAGLQRGDVITHINGTKLNINNYRIISEVSEETHNVLFDRYNTTSQALETQPEVSVSPIVLSENPNFLSKVITTPGGKKVGYYVYNFFSPGVGNSTEYDDQIKSIFADFQAQGIQELVLDLRYNSGGSISSAVTLASLIGIGVDETKIFSENKWNDLYQNYIESREDGDEILRTRFLNLSENIGDQLASGKVYILTGSRTASASELIINGLIPYMTVHQIGETTIGKNVGSIPIEDNENEQNTYGLLPIVMKTHNSLGQSNYENGFTPGPEDQVRDISALPLYPLGDMSEPLLARAIEHIDGVSSRLGTDREEAKSVIDLNEQVIGSSLDSKLRSNRLIIDLIPNR